MQVHQTPTLLLTRPRAASERFAEGLGNIDVIIAPLMEILGTGEPVSLTGAQGVILTSEAAVPFLPATSLPVYCVGQRTAATAQEADFAAETLGQDALELVNALTHRQPKAPLVHIHGTHTRGDIATRLNALGLPTTGIAVYDQKEVAPGPNFHAALARPGLVVPLFSPRSATLFAHAARGLRSDTTIIALSTAVAEALPENLRDRTLVVNTPNGAEMRRTLVRLWAKKI